MQNHSTNIDFTFTMTTTSYAIQGQERSHGDQGEKGIPVVLVGHKRKASQEINPFCESKNDETYPNNNGFRQIKLPSVLAPSAAEHQVNDEMVPLEGGDSEKVEGKKNMPNGGLELDLNKEATANSPNVENEENIVESDAINFKVESYFDKNIEVGSSEKVEEFKGMPHGGLLFDLNKEVEVEVETSLPLKIVFDFDLNEPLPNEDA